MYICRGGSNSLESHVHRDGKWGCRDARRCVYICVLTCSCVPSVFLMLPLYVMQCTFSVCITVLIPHEGQFQVCSLSLSVKVTLELFLKTSQFRHV